MISCPTIALLSFGMVCTVQVDRVVDGDTFKANFGGDVRSVRVIGIDTPERGERGFAEATRLAERRFKGRVVTLRIGGAKRRRAGMCVGKAVLDRYDRVLARVDGWPKVVRRWDKGPWCR
jgi:endonuclease YncB( thermonuclease family)